MGFNREYPSHPPAFPGVRQTRRRIAAPGEEPPGPRLPAGMKAGRDEPPPPAGRRVSALRNIIPVFPAVFKGKRRDFPFEIRAGGVSAASPCRALKKGGGKSAGGRKNRRRSPREGCLSLERASPPLTEAAGMRVIGVCLSPGKDGGTEAVPGSFGAFRTGSGSETDTPPGTDPVPSSPRRPPCPHSGSATARSRRPCIRFSPWDSGG